MKVKPLLQSINPSNFLVQYLQALGIQDVEKYLGAGLEDMDSPWDYPNMKEGVERLRKAIDDGEKIGVLVDADCDGNLSASLIVKFLLRFTNNLAYFFHVGKGHGLVQNKEEDIPQQILDSSVSLLIAPDSSTNDAPQCQWLKSNGVDVIICDHHEVTTPNPYAIIINHHLGEGLNTALSGTGVTHKFVQAYAETWDIDIGSLYYDLVAKIGRAHV